MAKEEAVFGSRIDQLNDNRTWTISARHELLFQKSVLPKETYELLSFARKARNKLSHDGTHPTSEIGYKTLNGLKQLIKVALPKQDIPFNDMDVDNHFLSDPFKPHVPKKIKPKYWMEIFKLPGELELEQTEAKIRSQLAKNKNSEQST